MKAILTIITLLLSLTVSSAAYACSCSYGGYWVSDFVKDKTIFEGRAVKAEWLGQSPPGQYRSYNSETSFQITKPFWNASASKVTLLHSSEDGASCGMNFSMGVDVLIVATSYEDNILRTSTCTANAIDEITLINYFENNIDVYIPSWDECSEAQIKTPKDPKNCYYLSTRAAQERNTEASKRRRASWKKTFEAKKALTTSDETP